MKPFVTTMVVAALAFAIISSRALAADDEKEATEPKAASAQEKMAALVKLGPGVHNIKKDKLGRVQSLILVGQARISTVLGGTKGTEMARQKAAQSARAEFVKWLGESVDVHQSQENEATLFIAGSEDNGKDALSESGKSVEKTSDTYKSAAAGLVRGLSLLHSDVNADKQTCTMVYGWSIANARAAKHTATNDPTIDEGKEAASSKAAEGKESGNSDKKKIRSESATSPDAEDFLK